MSVPIFQPEFPTPENGSPDFMLATDQTPGSLVPQSSEIQQETEHGLWPLITFEVSEQNVFGSSLPTNPNNRLRSVVRSLEAAVPGLTEENLPPQRPNSKATIPRMPAELCKDIRNKIQLAFRKVVARNGSSVDLTSRGGEFEKDLIQSHIADYQKTRHPVMQIMGEIQFLNEERQSQKQGNKNASIRTIPAYELDELCDNLIVICEGMRLVEAVTKETVLPEPTMLAARLAIYHTDNPDEL